MRMTCGVPVAMDLGSGLGWWEQRRPELGVEGGRP